MVYHNFFRIYAVGRVDLYYIKARLKLGLVCLKPKLRGHDNALLLCRGDELARLAVGIVFSELYLDKNYVITPFCDYIDLALPVAAVGVDNPVSVQPQIICGLALAESAEFFLCHQCIFLKKLGRCISHGPYSRRAS